MICFEPAGSYSHILHGGRGIELVCRQSIGNPSPVEQERPESQQLSGQPGTKALLRMPPRKKPRSFPAAELAQDSAAIHRIDMRPQGTQEDEIIHGIVFEIGVLNQNIIAGGLLNSALHGFSLALVVKLSDYFDARKTASDFSGFVFRAVIHYDDLLFKAECTGGNG